MLKSLTFFNCTEKRNWIYGKIHGPLSLWANEFILRRLFIPMAGMVQSLNVAASAAVILAEVARQMVFRFPMRKILSCKAALNVLQSLFQAFWHSMNSKTHRTIQYLCLFMPWDMELRSFSCVLRWFDNLDIAQDSGGTAIALDLFGI